MPGVCRRRMLRTLGLDRTLLCYSSCHLVTRQSLLTEWSSKSLVTGDAKSTPSYSLDLHLSVIKNRPDRGQLICSKYVWYSLVLRQSLGLLVFLSFKTILGPLSIELIFEHLLQISYFGRSDQKCLHRSDNCIIVLRKCRSEE